MSVWMHGRDETWVQDAWAPGGENLLHFLELRQVLSTYDRDLRDPLWWPQERPVPLRVVGGLSGLLSQ